MVEVNWRATKVITLDEAYVIVPNGQLAQASIRNFTKPDSWSRRSIYVVTPYEVSPQRVQRIILEAIRGSFGVLEHPAPSVVTNNFTDRGVEHWVRLFTNDFDKRDRVDGMARDRIWFALARNGVEIPTATQSIRLTQLPAPPLPEPAEARLARRVESLKRVGIFAGLSSGHLDRLAMEGRECRFAGGEPVIRQGDPGESLFVVLDGSVEVSAREGDGLPVVITTIGPGGFFGEMSLMTGAARSATITAKGESCLLEIDKSTMRRVLEEQPSLVETLGRALTDEIAGRLSPEPPRIALGHDPTVILVVGVNGSGKTTTIGKLAHRLTELGQKVVIGAGDTFRAAAVEQLAVWADRAGVDIVRQAPGADPGAVAFDAVAAGRARGADVVIIDTAGRLQTQHNLMEELRKVHGVVGKAMDGAPHHVLLVIDSTTGQNGLSQARMFSESVPVTGLVLTKFDGVARGGIVLAIERELGIPVTLMGVGETIGDLQPFDARAFAEAIFSPASGAGQ